MNHRALFVVLLACPISLSACGGTAPDPAAAPTAASAPITYTPGAVPATAVPAGALPSASDGLSGEDFIARAASLAGTTVTLNKCSLMSTPGSTGDYACRVIDAAGNDLKDPGGLPVDVFLVGTALDVTAKDFIATSCPDTFCTVRLNGKLAVSAATFYLSMTEVRLAAAP